MKLLKVGCGCIFLVEFEADTLAKSVVRLIDYCCREDSEGPQISDRRLMDAHVDAPNLLPDRVRELSAAESEDLFDKLSKLVADGHRFRELQRVLMATVKESV